jgi:phage terminase small subunit
MWTELCRQLSAIGVLTQVDGNALARYCDGWARWVALQRDDSPDPDSRRLEKMMKLSEHLLRFEMQYGLTPASRPHIQRLETPPHGNASAGKARFFHTA